MSKKEFPQGVIGTRAIKRQRANTQTSIRESVLRRKCNREYKVMSEELTWWDTFRAQEMAQRLRTNIAFAEDLGLDLST